MNAGLPHHLTAVFMLLIAGSLTHAAEPPTPGPSVQLRVYEGFATLGPVYGNRDTALAVDVTASLAHCGDGQLAIDAMTIGGWHYSVGNACGPASASNTTTAEPPPAPAPKRVIAGTRSAAPGAVIRCDASTWRCD